MLPDLHAQTSIGLLETEKAMKHAAFRNGLAVVAMVVCLGAIAWAGQAARLDVTGTWTLTVESPAGTSTPTVTFKQDGEKLTGRYSSQLMGEADVTGTAKDQTVDFSVSAEVQGTRVELRFSGTVEGKDSIKGKLSSEFGDGTFTGKRK